jgi:hypothetical protein
MRDFITLLIPITWIWNFAQRKQFPEENAIRPNVRLARKYTIS